MWVINPFGQRTPNLWRPGRSSLRILPETKSNAQLTPSLIVIGHENEWQIEIKAFDQICNKIHPPPPWAIPTFERTTQARTHPEEGPIFRPA